MALIENEEDQIAEVVILALMATILKAADRVAWPTSMPPPAHSYVQEASAILTAAMLKSGMKIK